MFSRQGRSLFSTPARESRFLEIALVVNAVGLAALLHISSGHKLAILNLFYLPVVLAGFFLGQYRAGILALFSVVSVTAVMLLDLPAFAAPGSPLVAFLGVTVWAGILGLSAIFVGTLSDERSTRVRELHDAHVGVVDVLSRYLHPSLMTRSRRVADLSARVATEMYFSDREASNVRVAALLQDMENLEITAKVMRNAVDALDVGTVGRQSHTFHSNDFVHSLGSVLSGALPLLLHCNEATLSSEADESTPPEPPLGARIIRAVRAFDGAVRTHDGTVRMSPQAALDELKMDVGSEYDPAVLTALERFVVSAPQDAEPTKPSRPERPLVAAGV
jgi:hypothetical protein